jgi:hypothetical protein
MKRMWILGGLIAVLIVGGGAGLGAGAAAPVAAPAAADAAAPAAVAAVAAAPCGVAWGSVPEEAGALSVASLLETRTGQHECWDRVVFEFAGPVDGYRVAYGNVHTDGQGLLLNPYVAGGAVLGVSLRAPAYDEHGATYDARSGAHVATVVGYRTLRDVMFGGSFEGYTTFAVGVRANLPFRVLVLAGPGAHSRIVVDVAHSWT